MRVEQLIATVGDTNLVIQGQGLDADIDALLAQFAQNRSELQAAMLVMTGATPRALQDELRTQVQARFSTI